MAKELTPIPQTVKRNLKRKNRKITVMADGTEVTLLPDKKGTSNKSREHIARVNAAADAKAKERGTSRLTPEMRARMWKPGQSGNPSGRPRRKPLTEAYKELVNSDAACPLPGYEHMTWRQAIAFAMATEAVLGGNVGGSVSAAAHLRDSLEGPNSAGDESRVPSVVINFGKDDEPIDDDDVPTEEPQEGTDAAA